MIEIGNGALSAVINPFGAELTHLRDADGRELMTDADPAFWTGHAPILFPVIGRVHGDVIRIGGVEYPMPKHGFARRSSFQIATASIDRATFRLTDSPDTRKAYPFAFALEIEFAIAGATLSIDARLNNPGSAPLPASFGFHPAFAWPLPYGAPRAGHRIVFDREEPGTLRVLTSDGLIAPGSRASPLAGRALALADDLFDDDALIWAPVESDSVRYGPADGAHLDIAFPRMPMLGIWTKPGAHYICVEPWHGIADPEDYAGEYRDKPGVVEIPPGETRTFTMSVTLVTQGQE
ncbi:aldose 1-epimerase family protein [soil metagenome]